MARQPGERERLMRGEISVYSETGGHSYSVCFHVFIENMHVSLCVRDSA